MVIEIKKPATKEKVREALLRISKVGKTKSLRKHLSRLERGIVAVVYQKKVRNEWI